MPDDRTACQDIRRVVYGMDKHGYGWLIKDFLAILASASEPEVMAKVVAAPKMRSDLCEIREWVMKCLGLV